MGDRNQIILLAIVALCVTIILWQLIPYKVCPAGTVFIPRFQVCVAGSYPENR